MYTPAPTAAELEYWGVNTKEYDEWHAIEVWPDNALAVRVFDAMATQWRSTGFGATGLDYNVLPFVLRAQGIPRKDWGEIFDELGVLERAALQTMHKHAERRRQHEARNRR